MIHGIHQTISRHGMPEPPSTTHQHEQTVIKQLYLHVQFGDITDVLSLVSSIR